MIPRMFYWRITLCTEPWGWPEANRLLWMTKRTVSQLLCGMEPADRDDIASTAIEIAWRNQHNPLSQRLIFHCIVSAYDLLFDYGRLLDQPRFAELKDFFVFQPELIDPPDNLVILDCWKKFKQM